eukprot:5056106-Amphidinium_carterae.1
MEWLLALAERFKDEEGMLHRSMPKHVEKIMAKKRVLLFIHLLRVCGVHDHSFEQGLVHGFDLVGDVSMSGMFQEQFLAAEVERGDLIGKVGSFGELFKAGVPEDDD